MRSRTYTSKASVYDRITDNIISQLEKGCIPWQQPWVGGGAPKNLISRKTYRGINTFILGSAGYASPYWLSFKQAKDLGGSVRRGEKGQTILFWKRLDKRQAEGEDTPAGSFMMAKSYTVFNALQCDLPGKLNELIMPEEKTGEFQEIEPARAIVANMPNPPTIEHEEARAYFRPSTDTVNMPPQNTFDGEEAYYSVLFHELTHSTGHAKRLGRETLSQALHFGSTNYSKEELCAEMGAAYLCGIAGIENETIDRSAAYIQGWLSKLRNDKKLLVQAASQAQRAADYILGTTFEGGE